MSKSNAAKAVKPIMILTSASILLSVALVLILAATGDQGFGVAYTPRTGCNTYLQAKYQVNIQTGYKYRFILTILSAICLAFQVAYFIKAYFRVGEIQSLKISDIIVWSQMELILIFIGYSLSLLSIIPLMGFYISILAERGTCLGEIDGKQITICILAIILFLVLLACWVLVVINYDTASNYERQNFHQSINHNDLKEREVEMTNIFEDSQSNKPFKYNNKQDLQEKLLLQNEPIPLLQSNNYKGEDSRSQNNQQYNYSMDVGKLGQFLIESPKPKASKKAVDKQQMNTIKMIEQRKRRFRELNPFKIIQRVNPDLNEQSIEQVVELPDEENRMKNLPKQYMQYIRQAKKLKRLPPTLQEIKQMIKKNEKRDPQQAVDEQKKKQRIKDKINQIKQQLIRKAEGQKKVEDKQIQFIEENQQIIEEKIKATQIDQPNEELFYYRPKLQKGLRRKKTKSLFDNEAYELAQLQADEQGENKLIINKLKDRNPSKHKVAEPLANLLKVQQKKQNKTNEDLMLEFLRKKYQQEQRQVHQQIFSGLPVQ